MKVLKTFIKAAFLLAALAYLVFALTTLNRPKEGQVCNGLDIYVSASDSSIINENDVRELLVSHKLFPEGKSMDDVDISQLTAVLTSSPYIDDAMCYLTAESRITIQVTAREPVLHVINDAGEDFYIDRKGHTMPRGHHQADLIVMTGHVSRATAGALYAPMGIALSKDTFWNRQTEEIHVTDAGELEITPRVGDHIIQLGDTSALSDKLSRMRLFYTEGLDKAGWNRYKIINLKYKDQVIATRY